jgi:hypothetical protein
MATISCPDEEAWQILVWVSQQSNTKVHDVVEAVVATTQQEPMPALAGLSELYGPHGRVMGAG